ncbi:MAG: SCP-2 sterol transfer family protein [Gammaproteobacteria bacterium]|nr:MAG: SCP-2 sterol transfer family protein [Gammaproteobacteria bacterium]
MSEQFSDSWMQQFMQAWNNEPQLADELKKIDFNSVIGYGIDGEDQPRGFITVENGEAVNAGSYASEALNWDIRASEKQWEAWRKKPPGMMGLGAAYTTRKIKFLTGDYMAMVKDPRMAKPFIKSFEVMARV